MLHSFTLFLDQFANAEAMTHPIYAVKPTIPAQNKYCRAFMPTPFP